MKQSQFLAILKQCTKNLQQTQTELFHLIKSRNYNSKVKDKAKILYQRINLQMRTYQGYARKVELKNVSQMSLKFMGDYIIGTSKKIIQQAHRLTVINSLAQQSTNFNTKRDRFNSVKYYEHQLQCEWEDFKNKGISVVRQQRKIQKGSLVSQAKQHLHKQFLAIRVLAYKMYERYTQHNHPEMQSAILTLIDEQSKIQKQMKQVAEQTKQLKKQQKQLQRQLCDLRKINQLISKRYFTSSSQHIQAPSVN